MDMKTYFRIELAFEGENQGCGLFHGIADIGLDAETDSYFENRFEELIPVPDVTEPSCFFFTEHGIKISKSLLREILDKIREYGWSFDVLILHTDKKPDMYQDECQAAWSKDTAPIAQCIARNTETPEAFMELVSGHLNA